MKKVLSFILVLSMVLGSFGMAFATPATGNTAIDEMVELGFVTGDEGGLRLNDTIKRSEVAAIVTRVLGLEEVAKASNWQGQFADVTPAHWANGNINIAAGRALVNGYPDGTFAPDKTITNAEAVTIMVRMLLDAKQLEDLNKIGSWPANYLAKAAELGILDGVTIPVYEEAATRETVFTLAYNAYTNQPSQELNVVKALVVENYRTESIKKDEIVVEVVRDVQINGVSYELGDEFKVTLDAKMGDVEDLLGKVVDVAFNKAGKTVKVTVDNSYDYLTGKVDDVKSNSLEVNDKKYTVEKTERRGDRNTNTNFDERLYQVYSNNEDVAYGDVTGFQYAKVTVKNGKVLFIDGFNFDDIAPVAKDIDSKNRVDYYDDIRDGAVNTIVVDEDAYVINFNSGKMTVGSNEDIAANDVMHWFVDTDKELTVVVRPANDNMVEGQYKEVNAAKAKDAADIKILVDKTEYKADLAEGVTPVFSTKAAEVEYYTLTEDYDTDLEHFEKKEVVILRDMFDKVQLIGSEVVDGTFYAVISDLYNYDFKLVNTANENTWFDSDRDTKFEGVEGTTRERKIGEFEEKDLVKVSADGEMLTKVTKVKADYEGDITKLTEDVVDFDGDFFYLSKRTVVFYTGGKAPKAMTVKDFTKNYDATKAMAGYVVVSDRDGKLVEVIVVGTATEKDNVKYDDLVVKVTRVRVTGETYRLDVVNPAGETATYYVAKDVAEEMLTTRNLLVVKDSIVEITVPKEADKDGNKEIKAMVELIDEKPEVFKVTKIGRDTARNENYMVLVDANGEPETVWVSRNADIFANYKVGNFVAIATEDGEAYVNEYNTTFVVDVVKATEATAVWEVEVDEDQVAAEAVVELIKDLTAVAEMTLADEAAVVAAREAYDALTAEAKALVPATALEALVVAEAKIAELKEVEVPQGSLTADDVVVADVLGMMTNVAITVPEGVTIDSVEFNGATMTEGTENSFGQLVFTFTTVNPTAEVVVNYTEGGVSYTLTK